MRFTHANRHCPDHPFEALKRCEDDFVLTQQPEEQSTEILKWIQKYREDRQQQLQQLAVSPSPSTANKKTPKRSSSSSKGNDENKKRVMSRSSLLSPGEVHQTHENYQTPTRTFARKGLMCEVDMNAGTAITNSSSQTSTPLISIATKISSEPMELLGSPISTNKPKYCRPKVILWKEPTELEEDPLDGVQIPPNKPEFVQQKISSPKKSFNPKKKWLREAWQDGCRPLDENSQTTVSNWQMNENNLDNPNQNRPSVLVIMGQKNMEKEYQNL